MLFKIINRAIEVKRRSLTQGEKKLAYDIFQNHLNVEKIDLVAHRLILKGYAMSPNGSIYFNPKDWIEDFSQTTIQQQSWLIHELVHIWQIQQGLKVVRQAFFDRRYSYLLEQGKLFLHYGIEQQAQMVQDYFIKIKTGQSCDDLAQCIPFISVFEDH